MKKIILALALAVAAASPSTVQPAAAKESRHAALSGRRLVMSDVLQVTVLNQPELNGSARVEPDGSIALPYTGRLRAAGRTESQLARDVEQALRAAQIVNEPHVLIEVTTFGAQVSILGAVNLPGAYTLDRPQTLTQVLAKAGGLREDSGAAVMVLRRQGKIKLRCDAKSLLRGGVDNIQIENNDEIYVEQGSIFYLYGYVNKPGQYPLNREMSVLQAVAAGGGVAPLGSDWRIEIKRKTSDGVTEVSRVNLEDPVRPDDVIVVNERIF